MEKRIDLNTADKDALDGIDGLRGHGHEIVRYREERGGFTSVDQLDEVPGLTGKIDDGIRSALRVGNG
jgi:DNA uptake protein ComE-like DNA-binding protein